MHPSLNRFLEKLRIQNPKELSPEERANFNQWNEILKEEKVSIESVIDFCTREKKAIENQFSPKNSDEYAKNLTLTHSVFSAIINLIEGNEQKRQATIAYIESLIDKT